MAAHGELGAFLATDAELSLRQARAADASAVPPAQPAC
jgi:hypothetical protein